MLTRKNRRSKRRKGGGQYYGMEAPIVLELPVEDPIIVFSEELKRQLMEKLAKKNFCERCFPTQLPISKYPVRNGCWCFA